MTSNCEPFQAPCVSICNPALHNNNSVPFSDNVLLEPAKRCVFMVIFGGEKNTLNSAWKWFQCCGWSLGINKLRVCRQIPVAPPKVGKVQVCKVGFGTWRCRLLACRRFRRFHSHPSRDRFREAPAKNSCVAKNKWPNSNRHAVERDCGHFLRAPRWVSAATSFHSVPLATDGWSSEVAAVPRLRVQNRWSAWHLRDGRTVKEIGQWQTKYIVTYAALLTLTGAIPKS